MNGVPGEYFVFRTVGSMTEEGKHFIRNVPFFCDLDGDSLDMITPLFESCKFKKGTVLFNEGDAGHDFFIIRTGTVAIFRYDSGKKMILSLLRPGDYFGEMSLLQPGKTRSAGAETIDTATLYRMKRSNFVNLLNRNPQLLYNLLVSTMERLRKANEQVRVLTLTNAKQRICNTLLRLSSEYGVPEAKGVLINMKLTHQQIADMAGTVRETVTKVLLELQDESMVKIKDRKIVMLEPFLRHLADTRNV